MPTLRTSRLLVALRTLPTLDLSLPTAAAQPAPMPAPHRAVPTTPAQPWRATLVPDTAWVDVISLLRLPGLDPARMNTAPNTPGGEVRDALLFPSRTPDQVVSPDGRWSG